jgi:hypothetical protein
MAAMSKIIKRAGTAKQIQIESVKRQLLSKGAKVQDTLDFAKTETAHGGQFLWWI